MHSTVSVDVAAPAELVFRLARDVDRWERLLPHYARSRAVAGAPDGALIVDFVARRPFVPLLGLGLPVAWRARTWSEPETRRLRFVHIAGATKGMDVTWRIEPTDAGCRVSIDHDFRPRVPGFAVFVDRAFTRPIAGRTLATFKALAEALADTPAARSGGRSAEAHANAQPETPAETRADVPAARRARKPRQSELPATANPRA
jgi:ribosome-associated toxin RatA of RatAB toxin-antitoxin module